MYELGMGVIATGLAEVALTVVPGAIGPVAKQIDDVLALAKAAENTSDAVKAVEKADIVADLSSGTAQSQRIAGAMQVVYYPHLFNALERHYTSCHPVEMEGDPNSRLNY